MGIKTWQMQIVYSCFHATLLYYLNSGYYSFDQYKEYAAWSHGKAVNVENICNEIKDQKLSGKELYNLIEDFYNAHLFDANLYGCGACGIREFESNSSCSKLQYHNIFLDTLPAIFEYSIEQIEHLEEMIERGSTTLFDNDGSVFEIQPWRVISYYVNRNSDPTYHLHPELVNTDDEGQAYTPFCPECHKCLKKDEASKLSIAKGLDFGNYH